MAERYDTGRRLGYRDESVSHLDARHRDKMAANAEQWLLDFLGEGTLIAGNQQHDPGWDIEYRGWKIDVKWTAREPGGNWYTPTYPHLIVPTWKPRRADIYVLVIGSMVERFDLFDWADGWEYRRTVEKSPVVDWGKQRQTSGKAAPGYTIGFDYLRRLDELYDVKERR
jgi:hypothetical protein